MANVANAPHFFSVLTGIFDMTYSVRQAVRLAAVCTCAALFAFFVVAPAAAKQATDITLKTTTLEDPYRNDGVSFRALCYHDVRDNLRNTMQAWPQMGALDTYDLIQHFSWLKENGYHPVSLDAIIAARNGGPKLLPKSVLLTFDDGYLSVYTRVFPLLKLYNYPAVIGLVGKWLEDPEQGKVFYGDEWVPREHFVTWPQVREMAASGLVEVASHSYGLHQGETANPQGGRPPSAITRIYDATTMRYESDAEYFERIRADLAHNSALIARHTGKKPRAMIWPYGAYNMVAVQAAQQVGMPVTMTLEAGPNTPDHPLTRVRRDMLFFHEKITDLKRNLRQPGEYDGVELPLNRVVGVDLDALYDPDAIKQEQKIGALVERILRLRVNLVYLQAFSDLNGDGNADALYFPNRHLPMRADLLNRVAWQLRTRGALPPDYVRVYVALPVTAFELSGRTHEKIKDIYEDAGKNAPRVAGIVFDDSAATSRETVLSPDSRQRANASEHQSLDRLTSDLAAAFRMYQPHALTVRKVSSSFLAAAAKTEIGRLSKRYDFVILSVTPEDKAVNSGSCFKNLVDCVMEIPEGLKRTVFEVRAVNDASRQPSSAIHLAQKLQQLQLNGARNFGYFPDDAVNDHPSLDVLRPLMSLKTNPSMHR